MGSYKKIFILFIAIIIISPFNFAWWNENWAYRQKIMLNTDGFLSENVTNDHPILIDVNSENTNFWGNVNTNGEDVRFVASNDTTDLNFHFEDFNNVSDVMVAWVRVNDTFNSASDTNIFLYYGNASASDGQNQEGTYSPDIVGAWHFDESSGNVFDSTSSNIDLAAGGTPTYSQTGQISNAISLDGSLDYFEYSGQGYNNNDASISFWVKTSANGVVVASSDEVTNNKYLKLRVANEGPNYYWSNVGFHWETANHNIKTGNWAHVIITSGTSMIMYVDFNVTAEVSGSSDDPDWFGETPDRDNFTFGVLHNSDGYAEYFNGLLDEIKHYDIVLSANDANLLFASESKQLAYFLTEELVSYSPDVNVIEPTAGETFGGTYDLNFNISDKDTNELLVDLWYSTVQGNKENSIYSDSNLADASGIICEDYDFSNSTNCTYSWNTSGVSAGDYYFDVNVSDSVNTDSNSSEQFSVIKTSIDENVFSRVELTDLTEDGVNVGEISEGWTQGESKSKSLSAVNVNRKQFFVIKTLNDNSALSIYLNSNLIGTVDANAANPQNWQLYVFDANSNYLTGNPQTIRIDAGGSQDPTYVDWIGLMDSIDGNIVAGGDSVGFIWDYNSFGSAVTSNQLVVDQNGTYSYVDANIVNSSNGKYMAVLESIDSLNQDINAWINIVGDSNKVSDTNKSMIVDSTNPVINSVSMDYFDVITGRNYGFDSNNTDLYFSSGILDIESVDYDLNKENISGNDWNAYGSFTFGSSGNYSATLKIYDEADNNATYPFTVRASTVTVSIGTETVDTNFTRSGAVDINSTAGYTDVSFRATIDYTSVGTANLTYYDFNYDLNNGHGAAGSRGAIKNALLTRENKSNLSLPATANQTGVVASDLNGNVSVQDILTYDVNNAITVEWKNTGVDDARLVWISPQDVNSTLTDFWVVVEVRTPFNGESNKIVFKECTTGANFGAGTCTEYTEYDIYDETESTFNGGTFPTEDSDSDDLKDVVYFKISTLTGNMFYIDLTTGAETTWTGTPQQGSPGGPGGPSRKPVDTNQPSIVDDILETPPFQIFGGLLGNFGDVLGGIAEWANLQITRLFAQNILAPENIFTIISLIILVIIAFIFIPSQESKTRVKGFGVQRV